MCPTVREESRAKGPIENRRIENRQQSQESRIKNQDIRCQISDTRAKRPIENRPDSRLQILDIRHQISDMLKWRDYILHIIIIKDQKVSQQMTKH